MEVERNLDLTITLNVTANDEGDFKIFINEPQSGCNITYEFPYSPDEHPEMNEVIGNEIYSWISMWMDEMDEMEDE